MFMLLHGAVNNKLNDVCVNALYDVVVDAMPGIFLAGLQDLLFFYLFWLVCCVHVS